MRLIDANALSDALGEMWGIPKDWDGHMDETCEDAFDAIENAPEVIVRCRDCENWDEEEVFADGCGVCFAWSTTTQTHVTANDDFCSRAIRMDDNEINRRQQFF